MNKERHLNFIAILKEIGEAMNSNLEPTAFFKLALEKCIKFTNSDIGSIIVIDEEKKILEIKHQVGLGDKAQKNVKLKIGEGVTGLAAKEKRTILANDVHQSPIYIEVNPQVKSECAVPIIYKKKLLGVISVNSKNKNNYGKQEVELIQTVSGHFGQVLNNIEHVSELEIKLYYDEILLKINEILSSSLNLNTTLEEMFMLLKNWGRFKRGALILENEKQNKLAMRAYFGYSKKQAERGHYEFGEGAVGRAYQSQKTIAIKDVGRDALFLNKTGSRGPREKTFSFFAIPLIANARVIGILSLDKEYENKKVFKQNLNFLEMLATQISKQLQIHFLAQKEHIKLARENEALKNIFQEKDSFGDIIGRSHKMKTIYQQIKAVATSDSTVLITGESGTGKELVAAAIHYNSHRRDKPFIVVNCAALPEHLIESELFGHEKGAFTGASAKKAGKFKLADSGTLFLDEIGEMPLPLQSKLLRTLQSGTIDPVGAEKSVQVDVRVVAATNRNLLAEVGNKNFREDLYYRLSILPLGLPPLRERKEDIPLLIEHFLEEYQRKFNKKSLNITPAGVEKLLNHPWPGNIRELKNVLERSLVFCEGETLDHIFIDESKESFPAGGPSSMPSPDAHKPSNRSDMSDIKEELTEWISQFVKEKREYTLKEFRDFFEAIVIRQSLLKAKGVHVQVAKDLDVSRETLKKRVKELGIDIYRSP